MTEMEIREGVKQYYGEELKSSSDLRTSACCSIESIPEHHKTILGQIDDEILSRFYGCGSPIPTGLEGCRVLDLGCGTGRDVYLLSKLVGSHGHVIGVDMTEDQLDVAQRHIGSQMSRFGFAEPNVSFQHGMIEDLGALGLEDNSIDVVVSNCVINLSTDKQSVFEEIFRVLKPGGELYFSDVFSDRRIPEVLTKDRIFVGECLGGALYTEDFRRLMEKVGFVDHRVVSTSAIELKDPVVESMAGMIDFKSLTVRAFKLKDTLEDRCEDYGQVAIYNGKDPYSPHKFILDDHHVFEKGRPVLVCGNTASMLSETRYRQFFEVNGDRSTHFGIFDCGPESKTFSDGNNIGACC